VQNYSFFLEQSNIPFEIAIVCQIIVSKAIDFLKTIPCMLNSPMNHCNNNDVDVTLLYAI